LNSTLRWNLKLFYGVYPQPCGWDGVRQFLRWMLARCTSEVAGP